MRGASQGAVEDLDRKPMTVGHDGVGSGGGSRSGELDVAIGARQSVAWRLLLPLPIVLLVAIASIWLIVPKVVASMAINDAIMANKQLADQYRAIRTYYSDNVVKKVVKDGAFRLAYDHKSDPKAIPLPATFLHDLSSLFLDWDTTISLYSKYPFPALKDRVLDDFQEQAWRVLNAEPRAVFSRTELVNGRQTVRVAVADVMTSQTCLNCHNGDPQSPKTDWKIGDVRGVLEVSTVIEDALAHGSALTRYFLVGAVATGLVLLGLSLMAIRSVTRPLGGMVGAMRRLASGNFEVVLPGLGRGDEIGAMANAVELFKAKAIERARSDAVKEEAAQRDAADARRADMRKLADNFEAIVGNIVDAVTSASRDLEGAASTLSSSADTTKQLSGIVAAASEEASINVRSVAAASQQLAASVDQISREVRESGNIAGDAVRQARHTDERITELSQAATRIGNVVKLITAIAEQTNLLALNATIEAARAGDAGRGFAVVASEVKHLATQTAKATEDIGAQIAGMQSATRDSVSAIKEIGSTILSISETAATIAAAVEEQNATTKNISLNVEDAAKGTTQVANTITDVNRAAQDTDEASTQVLGLAKALSSEGGKLKMEVERFLATVRAA